MFLRPVTYSAFRVVASAAPSRQILSPSIRIFQRSLASVAILPPPRQSRIFSYTPNGMIVEKMSDAITGNKKDELKDLLKNNKEAALAHGHNLVVLAAHVLNRDALGILIEAKISVESRDYYGNPPLHTFQYHHDYDRVKLLQEFGADINQIDLYQNTLLNKVITNFYYVPRLIELGASVMRGALSGYHARFFSTHSTLLHQLANDSRAAKALEISLKQAGGSLAKAWANTPDRRGSTPLMEALGHGTYHFDHATSLLRHGADPEIQAFDGSSAQSMAKDLGLPKLETGVPIQGPGWIKR